MLGVKRRGASQWRKIGGWDWHDEANKPEYTGSIPKTIRKKIPTLLGQIRKKHPIFNYTTRTVRLDPWLYKITFRQGDSSNYGDVYRRYSSWARFLWFIRSLVYKKNIYLISDTHFDHANIIKYCNRPYGNVREMNRALTINWNSVVRPRDTVYFLGDWSFGRGSRPPKYWIRRLNGHIISIKGSHDRLIRGMRLHERKVICYGKHRFLLLHDPSQAPSSWNDWIIHGHKHNSNMRNYPFINGKKKTINISVELIKYKPISIDYLLSLNIDKIKRMETIASKPER